MEELPNTPAEESSEEDSSPSEEEISTVALETLDEMGEDTPVYPLDTSEQPVDRLSLLGEDLTPKRKRMLDLFVDEYIVDFNPTNACIRAGFKVKFPYQKAQRLLREPYVQKKIWQVVENIDEKMLVSRKKVLGMLLREANFDAHGASHGARVAAIGKLATVLGMDQHNINIKGNINHNVRGGVMLVPLMPGTEEWEKLASNSQKQLKDDIRE